MERYKSHLEQFKAAHVTEFGAMFKAVEQLSDSLEYIRTSLTSELTKLETKLTVYKKEEKPNDNFSEDQNIISDRNSCNNENNLNTYDILHRLKIEGHRAISEFSTQIRSNVNQLARTATNCLSASPTLPKMRSSKLSSETVYADTETTDNNYVTFAAKCPDTALLLQSIAKHFLHLNRVSLFESLCQEASMIGIQTNTIFNNILSKHPWKVTDCSDKTTSSGLHEFNDTLLIPENKDINQCKLLSLAVSSPNKKDYNIDLNNSSHVLPPPPLQLLPYEAVYAYEELHLIMRELQNGQCKRAIMWFKSLSLKKQQKHLYLFFYLYEIDLYSLIISAYNSKIDFSTISLMLLTYIREYLLIFLPQLRSEISHLLGSFALHGKLLQQSYNSENHLLNEPLPPLTIGKVIELFSHTNKEQQTCTSNGLLYVKMKCVIKEHIACHTYCNVHCATLSSKQLSQLYYALSIDFRRVFCTLGTSNKQQGQQIMNQSIQSYSIHHDQDVNGHYKQITTPINNKLFISHAKEYPTLYTQYQQEDILVDSVSIIRLPYESPLAVAVAAGIACLPQIQNLLNCLYHGNSIDQIQTWQITNKLPLDLDLGPLFHFHTSFTCPICRTSDVEAICLRPCRLPCGHVICRTCLDKLTARTRRHTVKCPTCPHQASAASIQELVFDWVDSSNLMLSLPSSSSST